jgi:hypothetical protein
MFPEDFLPGEGSWIQNSDGDSGGTLKVSARAIISWMLTYTVVVTMTMELSSFGAEVMVLLCCEIVAYDCVTSFSLNEATKCILTGSSSVGAGSIGPGNVIG